MRLINFREWHHSCARNEASFHLPTVWGEKQLGGVKKSNEKVSEMPVFEPTTARPGKYTRRRTTEQNGSMLGLQL
jgi:hypothetical protein